MTSSLVERFNVMDDNRPYHTRAVSNKDLIIPHSHLSICKTFHIVVPLFGIHYQLKSVVHPYCLFLNICQNIILYQTDSMHSLEASVLLLCIFYSSGLQCKTVIFLN